MHQSYRLYAASRQRATDRELELPGRSLKHLTASPCQLQGCSRAATAQSCIGRACQCLLLSEPAPGCRFNARLKDIQLNNDGSVKCYRLADGSTVEGDLYVSAMPGEALTWSIEQ